MIEKPQRLPNPHYLPTRLYTELHNIVRDLNIDINQLLQGTGLSKDQLKEAGNDTAETIGQRASEQLITGLLRLSDNPSLGFDLGQRYNFTSHGIVGFAALAGENLAKALEIGAKYFPLITHLFKLNAPRSYTASNKRADTGAQDNLCVIEIESQGDILPELEHFMVEAMLSNMHVMAEFVIGDAFPTYRLELPYALQDYHQVYADSKKICMSGEHQQTRIIISDEILDQGLPLSDAISLEKSLEQCDALLALCQNEPASLSEQILTRLNQVDNLFLSQESIAQELNISTRAMHRQLSKENRNFRDIAIQARAEHAKYLLRETDYSISQVAHELGYSDAANFARAFKKLSGVSPSDFRKKFRLPCS